jgi:hypothetical protein
MYAKAKILAPIGLAVLFLLPPGLSRADTTYTYTGNPFDGFGVEVEFTTALSGAQLFNLPPGTDIGYLLFSLSYPAPPQDNAGFALADHNFEPLPVVLQIGTNGVGNITSWNISQNLFASYPIFAGEDPNDFFCRYSVSTSTNVDQRALIEDHDAGLCPASTALREQPGVWESTVSPPAVPEPDTWMLFGAGLLSLLAFARPKGRARA